MMSSEVNVFMENVFWILKWIHARKWMSNSDFQLQFCQKLFHKKSFSQNRLSKELEFVHDNIESLRWSIALYLNSIDFYWIFMVFKVKYMFIYKFT